MVLFLIILFGAAIVGRLVFLQVVKQGYYKAMARGQQNIFNVNGFERGEIFLKDKQGNSYPLAINKKIPLVYISPQEVQDKDKVSQTLSEILDLDENQILQKINYQDSLYQLIKNRLSSEEEARIRKEDMEGVYVRDEKIRYYPQGEFASQVIGFLGGEGQGQYGIEGYYNEELEGQDLVLGLDYNIQFQAEELLKKEQERLGFKDAEILVMQPKTGKIIALAQVPSFDPNRYWEVKDIGVFQNGVIQKIFEPGSVFKPITMVIGLEEGKISPETFYDDKGYVKIGGYTIYNYDKRVWGRQNMIEVLEKSINTGAVFAGSQIEHELFLQYIEKFGAFEPTGIDLEQEFFSRNSEFKKGYEINFATASFGQGIEMTALQMARMYCVIANGGKLVEPYVVEGRGSDSGREVISARSASQMTAMLVSVVKNGFASGAQVPGYYIAGKTGTAQVSWSALGVKKLGYSDETIQTFIGFFPAFDPQFLILVRLNNPATKTAEYSAVPIFQKLAKYIIDYWQIPSHE